MARSLLSLFQNWTTLLTRGIETIAGILIALAALRAVIFAFPLLYRKTATLREKEDVRIQLSGWLALGLEFELAADILRTTMTPNWNSLGQLAAIITLRTALNFILQKEIERAQSVSG